MDDQPRTAQRHALFMAIQGKLLRSPGATRVFKTLCHMALSNAK